MNYQLPGDIQHRIDIQLATGAFTDEEQVLREAIDALERRQRGLQKLRAMVTIAEADSATGRVGVFDRDGIKRDVHNRLAEQGIVD